MDHLLKVSYQKSQVFLLIDHVKFCCLIYRMYNIILNYIINHGMDIKYQDLINAGEPIIEVEESLD